MAIQDSYYESLLSTMLLLHLNALSRKWEKRGAVVENMGITDRSSALLPRVFTGRITFVLLPVFPMYCLCNNVLCWHISHDLKRVLLILSYVVVIMGSFMHKSDIQ